MTKEEFQKLTQDVVLLDGATGSNLMAAGMPRGICTEAWIMEHKEVLQNLQKAYVEAGSQIVYAPTFGGNRYSLGSVPSSRSARVLRASARPRSSAVRSSGFG